MKRIFILGSSGSGKTTLANKLSEKLVITYYGLDWIVYKKPWSIKNSERVRDNQLKKLSNKSEWIIDGAYSDEWILPVIRKSDLIILLKPSSFVIIKRIIARYLKNNLKDGLKDTLILLKWGIKYRKDGFIAHKTMAEKNRKKYIILRNNKQIKSFLDKI